MIAAITSGLLSTSRSLFEIARLVGSVTTKIGFVRSIALDPSAPAVQHQNTFI